MEIEFSCVHTPFGGVKRPHNVYEEVGLRRKALEAGDSKSGLSLPRKRMEKKRTTKDRMKNKN